MKKAKKKKSARQIAEEYARDTGKTISDRTIRRIIHEGGLAYMKKKKIEKLTPANIKKRLAYAKDMKDFDWNFVLFSDGKPFISELKRQCAGKTLRTETKWKCLNIQLN